MKYAIIQDELGSGVFGVQVKDGGYYVPDMQQMKKVTQVFDTVEEAFYSNLLLKLDKDINAFEDNYQTSPFFEYYKKRLKIEYPEYLI